MRVQASGQGNPSSDPLVGLLAQVAVRDQAALETLYDLMSARVFGMAVRVLFYRELAEEATLDAFHQIWEQASRYDPGKGSPTSWILTLTRTRAIDVLRNRRRHAERETSIDAVAERMDDGEGPDQALASSMRATRVRRAIDMLPSDQRRAIEAAFFEGLSHSEVASVLGQPLGTVKTRIRAGLSALRELLIEESELPS